MKLPANYDVGILTFKRGFSPTVELANGMVVVDSVLSTGFNGGQLDINGAAIRIVLDDGQAFAYRHRGSCWHVE